MALVELLLGDPDGQDKVIIWQLRVNDLVAVLGQERRLDAAWYRLPTMKEEDGHGGIVLDDRPAHDGYNSIARSILQTASDHPMENTPSSKVRVAVVQAAPVMFDTQRSLQKLADFTGAAAKQGAGLVVFPEAFIAGYPKGHDFGV